MTVFKLREEVLETIKENVKEVNSYNGKLIAKDLYEQAGIVNGDTYFSKSLGVEVKVTMFRYKEINTGDDIVYKLTYIVEDVTGAETLVQSDDLTKEFPVKEEKGDE